MSWFTTLIVIMLVVPTLLFIAASVVGRFGLVPVILTSLGLITLYLITVVPIGAMSGLGFVLVGLIIRAGLTIVRDTKLQDAESTSEESA